MATDMVQSIHEGLVTIAEPDPTLQLLCGRASDLLRPYQALDDATVLPVLLYHLVSLVEVGSYKDTREGVIQITAVADGDDAEETVNGLLERAEQLFTAPNFAVAGLDAYVARRQRRGSEHDQEIRRVHADLDITIVITK